MAYTKIPKRPFKPAKGLKTTWEGFRKGLNTTFRDSELDPEQAKELTNLMLEGEGIVTQKPGSAVYYNGASAGKIRGLFGSKMNDVISLLAMSDVGCLTKQNGTAHTDITGYSWASGYKTRMSQLGEKVYLVQQETPLRRYDGTTLQSYTTITSPWGLTATNVSGATGGFTWSWRVAATTDVGRSLASDPVVLSNLPEDLADTAVRVNWNAPTNASGSVNGFEIYGREQGAETRMIGVPKETLSWIDDGAQTPSQIGFLPDNNETGGPMARYIIKSAGKMIIANLKGHKTRIMGSGANENVGKFVWSKGGFYYDIEAGAGEEVTGIHERSENNIIIMLDRSIYQMGLSYNADLGIVEPTVKKITDAVGCVSGDTIKTVNNSTFFAGRMSGSGLTVHALDYEPNISALVLRTFDMGPQIRTTLNAVNMARIQDMFAISFDQKYWLFYPIGASTMKALCYDWQRRGFTGPFDVPNNPCVGTVFYDDNDKEHFLMGSGDDGNVIEVSNNYSSDLGNSISWSFLSKKEDFGLPFQAKTLLRAFVHLANISGGTVNVAIITEKTDGQSTTEASFTVNATNILAGWGSFPFGKGIGWGSSQQASTSSSNLSEIRKFIDLNTSSVVTAQVKISSSSAKGKIIAIELRASPEPGDPSDWLAE